MALQVCTVCSTRYAPAAQCPNCGANEWQPDYAADEQSAEVAPAVPEVAQEPPGPTPPEAPAIPAAASILKKNSAAPSEAAADDADADPQ
jgi:predicted  nucleic acid-binding Zn-ribbon protein